MSNPLSKFRILITDSDQRLSLVLKLMLSTMGFSNVKIARNGEHARGLLAEEPYDFLITEWNMPRVDGIELLNHIRHESANPALPIIMLTGRAEASDVAEARDQGINEYVVKPFSAQAVYDRLERLIEKPRNFIVSKTFVGPDRRFHGKPPEGMPDRRTRTVQPQRFTQITSKDLVVGDTPKLWLPDMALKRKLGTNVSLPSLITPAILNQAQASIDAISNESLKWIKENLEEVKFLLYAMGKEKHPQFLVAQMGEVALTIHSRAGTFGYKQASEIAYMLYLFCRNQMQPHDPTHIAIAQKHIEVLQVILANAAQGKQDKSAGEIVIALRHLVNKYASALAEESQVSLIDTEEKPVII